MSELDKQIKGVVEESPASESESKEEGKTELTLENIKGELFRKNGEFQDKLMQTVRDQFADLTGKVQPVPQPQPSAPKPIEQMTSSELIGLRGQATEEQGPALETLIAQKQMDEKQENRFNTWAQEQAFEAEKKKHNRLATDRYPGLEIEGSTFRREVEKRLSEVDDITVRTNPRIVLDMANEVAVDQNVAPERRIVQSLTKTARGDTAPVERPEPKASVSPEREKELAKMFQRGLPKGEEFDMDAIAKRRQDLSGDLGLHIKEGGEWGK